MNKLRTSTKAHCAVVTAALLFTALPSSAEITEPNAKRIKPDYPPGSMTEWLLAADQFALNPVNIRAGKHPDRDDPEGGPYDVVYIFPDAASANAWWDPTNPATPDPPDEIPASAVALIHWELDNASGSFPGVMSKSDVDGFKSRNCIMAAGDVIPVLGVGDIEKTCSNPQGTSKRFKMNVLIPDVPIDLVYNVEQQPLTYFNYDTLPTFDGIEESGRIYRFLQKWHNATSMDATDATGSPVLRSGARIAGYRLELGTGVGAGFVPIVNAAADGLAPDKALGMELRPCMPDHFFDVKRDPPGTGTNPCADDFDSLGQPLPQEIWLEEEYATFAPKMYATVDDKRLAGLGIPGGFWEKRPGGIYPPEIQTLGKLDSGYKPSDDAVYWDSRIDGSSPLSGYYGATTPNYFDIVSRQATDVGATTRDTINPPSPFGYLMHFGVQSDGDTGILSQGIYRDDDGLPSTEGNLFAWWDGDEYRWGIDGEVFDGIVTPDEAFAPVELQTLKEWALHPLVEDCNELDPAAENACPPGPLYESGVMDDLGGLNIDHFVYLGRNFDLANTSFTVRLTTVSVDNADPYGDGTPTPFPLTGTTGDQTPAWVSSPAVELSEFIDEDGIIDIRGNIAGEPVIATLGDTDVVDTGRLTVPIENLRSGEIEQLTLVQDPALDWRYTAALATNVDHVAGDDNDGFLNVMLGDTVRVTYLDEFIGGDTNDPANFDVVKTDEVTMTATNVEGNIDIEKQTNGRQADGADDFDVPRIAPASLVTWTYDVVNTGTVAFPAAAILVSDSQAGVTPVLDPSSDAGGDMILSPGESWLYTASAAAFDLSTPPLGVTTVAGCNDARNTYENTGRVDISGTTVFDEDNSHYCNPGDVDADGVTDSEDNCMLVPNGPLIPDPGGNVQLDTDADNYGNICDPDFNSDLVVNATDLAYMKLHFFSDDADADLTGDGVVNFTDLTILKQMFFMPPGPSGLVP